MQKTDNVTCWMMMMDFLRCKKKAKKDFCNLPEGYKTNNNKWTKTSLLGLAKKLNISHRNCMKTKKELEKAIKGTITESKEIIFLPDNPVCKACLNELRRQQVIDKKVYDQKLRDDTWRKLAWDKLQNNVVMDGDVMIDERTGELLDPEIDLMYWKENFKGWFIVFVDHKITCRKVEELHIWNDTDTLDTWSICDFS